jgi:hypothetical protein
MKIGIGGDVHSNYHALRAVVDDMEDSGIEEIFLLGDLVGYNAHPERCAREVRNHGRIRCIDGNHDLISLVGRGVEPKGRLKPALENIGSFNTYALAGAEHSAAQLSDDSIRYLSGLPFTVRFDHSVGAHAGLGPELFTFHKYFYDDMGHEDLARRKEVVSAELRRISRQEGKAINTFFAAHSHVPGYEMLGAFFHAPEGTELYVGDTAIKRIITVGSVGQPRDRDPRASWVEYDLDRNMVFFRRTEYDADAAARDNIKAGLPDFLAGRLLVGF